MYKEYGDEIGTEFQISKKIEASYRDKLFERNLE